jgi:hypothetical protein
LQTAFQLHLWFARYTTQSSLNSFWQGSC